MPRHDVAIVGARVAGAATALLLARAGHDVLVLDRDEPGTDTLSTHALMRPAVLQLDRWGLLEEVIAAGTPPQRQVVFHYDGERVTVDVSRALYAPRRTVLDPILVGAARRAGADVRFGVDVRDTIADHTGRVVGVTTRSASGPDHHLARVTVGADGRRSRIARAVDAPITRAGRHRAAALYGYWSGVDTHGYTWAFTPGRAAGLIPTDDGLVCVYGGAPRQRFLDELRHDREAGLLRLVEEASPELAARLDGGRRHGPVRGFPGLRGWLRHPRGPGWALVGDAGFFKDPITAHGLTDALRDAELLARDLHADLTGQRTDTADTYVQRRNEVAAPVFELTERIASLDWDLAELQGHHMAISEAMGHEYELLAALGPPPGARPAVAA